MSQYANTEVEKEAMIDLTWHGEPTLVLLDGAEEKTEVATGATIKVTASQAKRLISYSSKWTMKGDKPVAHGFEDARARALAAQDERMRQRIARKSGKKAAPAPTNADGTAAPTVETLTDDEIDAMKNKKDIVAALKERGVKANKEATPDELKSLLKETIKERAAAAASQNAPAADETKTDDASKDGEGSGDADGADADNQE